MATVLQSQWGGFFQVLWGGHWITKLSRHFDLISTLCQCNPWVHVRVIFKKRAFSGQSRVGPSVLNWHLGVRQLSSVHLEEFTSSAAWLHEYHRFTLYVSLTIWRDDNGLIFKIRYGPAVVLDGHLVVWEILFYIWSVLHPCESLSYPNMDMCFTIRGPRTRAHWPDCFCLDSSSCINLPHFSGHRDDLLNSKADVRFLLRLFCASLSPVQLCANSIPHTNTTMSICMLNPLVCYWWTLLSRGRLYKEIWGVAHIACLYHVHC